jgi:hypothetical protein
VSDESSPSGFVIGLSGFVSGRDFSRAEKVPQIEGALAPEGSLLTFESGGRDSSGTPWRLREASTSPHITWGTSSRTKAPNKPNPRGDSPSPNPVPSAPGRVYLIFSLSSERTR